MVKFGKRLKWREILNLVEQLPERDRLRLFKQLEQKAWARQLEKAVRPIRVRLKSRKITDADINRVVEEVRLRRYESRTSRM